ncbi:cysteine protease atg4 [Penicillium atrosanguineum]|nr:cysteine protease atg4 [Penicillium atrosanguineum]
MTGVDLEKCKRIVQYFWDPEPKNDMAPEAAIWCLGQMYAPPLQIASGEPERHNAPSSSKRAGAPNDTAGFAWPEAFMKDFESRIWMTYRSNFTPIPETTHQKQHPRCHWGAYSRIPSAFYYLAEVTTEIPTRVGIALTRTTDWRRGQRPEEESKLLAMFADYSEAPFSIHRFVKCGAESCGKYPGEWFGPSATARCIQTLSNECEDPKLRVYVTNDTSDVYEDQFTRLARGENGRFQPTLILLGLRLVDDRRHPIISWACRIHSFFFLDPHITRPTIPAKGPDEVHTPEEVDSYHTRRLRRIHIKDMDPSMLIGFLIRDEADWADWKERVKSTPGKPIIHIVTSGVQTDEGIGREEALDEVEALDDSDALE